jgi:3-(3-hydroxy-phenyl)propionate hydroxylase
MNPQVLVVGAGPSGLVMALELARHGVPCRIIEKLAIPSDKSRAIGIQARTLELFEKMGVVEFFTKRGRPARAFNLFSNGRRIVRLSFKGLESSYPYILVLQQTETEQILTHQLEKVYGIMIERSTELLEFRQDKKSVTAVLRGLNGTETVTVPWLIGCDGAHSEVRHQLGLEFVGETMETRFILADFRVDGSLPHEEVAAFTAPTGAAVFFPLPDNYYRMIATNPPPGVEGDRLPSLAECQAMVDARGPGGLRLYDPLWLANFRVNSRLTSRMREGRVFLMGDAAHIHSPAGAQGMNIGIQDAINLGWKLGLVAHSAADPALLDTYNAERYPVEQNVLQLTDFFIKLITTRSSIVRAARNFVAPLLIRFHFVQSIFRRRLSQISINYRYSSIVEDHSTGCGPKAGDRAPDANATIAKNQTETRLFQALTGTNHWLILFSGIDPLPQSLLTLEQIRLEIEARYGKVISTVAVVPGPDSAVPLAGATTLLHDKDGALHRLYGVKTPALYLIRPDGYIAFRGPANDGEQLKRYLTRVLI